MKRTLILFAATILFASCGSEKQEQQSDQDQTGQDQPAQTTELQSKEEWIRPTPVQNVAQFDLNHDGYVYNDNMCWNVIADEPGKCPHCGMKMKQVTVAQAEAKLKEHGMME